MMFKVGQRWVSQTEPKLGLGIVSEVAGRRVSISFPAADEVRTYATDNAPVSRVIYENGDMVTNHDDQEFSIQDHQDYDGLVVYDVIDASGANTKLSEVELNCFIQFTSPMQRLISGHYDRNRAFRLRYQTLQQINRLQTSDTRGLLGSRTSLLPHQVYIAHTVAQRFAPRVLLADEVGLGKTIEAGMIIHAQLQRGLGSRVLICVPSSLIYQWLVEMLRRFNLRFSIFDRERLEALREEGMENPFESEQLVLCDLATLTEDEETLEQAQQAQWDLFVVDEAHHLEWSPEKASIEYQCVESIAELSRGVLLLTATPEQAGLESHFARLRLLDADRFHDLSAFMDQEAHYTEIADLVRRLQLAAPNQTLDASLQSELQKLLDSAQDYDWSLSAEELVPDLVNEILDLHGTGRILFRNTRQAVEGFPERRLHHYGLLGCESDDLLKDPRVGWLVEFLKEVRPEKVLVICSSAERALVLEEYLRLRQGMRSAAFYEGLSIIERDRAAAYFADREEGAQVLVCSEIGSEGRNFQFANNLVLFDLPKNPDLLEQRIGRLDRIGQLRDVNIHVPYLQGTEQEAWFRWYHNALNAFEHSCSAGYAIQQHFKEELEIFLTNKNFESKEALTFMSEAKVYRDRVMAELDEGRNPLIELNSCRADVASDLIEQLVEMETSHNLSTYMDTLFGLFGVEQEHQSDASVVVRPGENMLMHEFPGLKEEGATITYQREKALTREDYDFLTWEHPMVSEAMEMLVSGELGNAALAKISVQGVKPGTLFLESIFVLNSMAPTHLQLDRFLPLTPRRFVVNLDGRDLSSVLPYDKLNELCSGIKRNLSHAILKEIRDDIKTLVGHAQSLAEKAMPGLLQAAEEQLAETMDKEIHRLRSLREKNPLIREEEIAFLENQKAQGLSYIEKTGLEMQALRVIIAT